MLSKEEIEKLEREIKRYDMLIADTELLISDGNKAVEVMGEVDFGDKEQFMKYFRLQRNINGFEEDIKTYKTERQSRIDAIRVNNENFEEMNELEKAVGKNFNQALMDVIQGCGKDGIITYPAKKIADLMVLGPYNEHFDLFHFTGRDSGLEETFVGFAQEHKDDAIYAVKFLAKSGDKYYGKYDCGKFDALDGADDGAAWVAAVQAARAMVNYAVFCNVVAWICNGRKIA